ncbi:MAG TPA: hypothetical protein VHC22_13285 [Pirellulales bacterium]|nr:hypothetical protein [Pirellulales bacterium]
MEKPKVAVDSRKLSHEDTLKWIRSNRAWRRAWKTECISVRDLDADEIGKEFKTVDHAIEVAREGFWLCVGVEGEPWFQEPAKVERKYSETGEEETQFSFDASKRRYRVFAPRPDIRNWAAQVKSPEFDGFFIRPNYDMEHPLYSPSGGYVVTADVADPYDPTLDDVWLVQQSLFEKTYKTEKTERPSGEKHIPPATGR